MTPYSLEGAEGTVLVDVLDLTQALLQRREVLVGCVNQSPRRRRLLEEPKAGSGQLNALGNTSMVKEDDELGLQLLASEGDEGG